MKRSHRVALKLTPEQESLFSQHAGYARFATTGPWVNSRLAWTMVSGCLKRHSGCAGTRSRGSSRCAQAHTGTGVAVQSARRLCAVRYNWAVGEFKAGMDDGEWLSEKTLRLCWNKVKGIIASWGAALSQNAAKYVIIDFGQASAVWGAHRKRVKAGQRSGRRVGFPRLKRRRHE